MEHAPIQGAQWFNGLERAVQSLRVDPERCPRAPESKEFQEDLRELFYGRRRGVYRILFRVDETAKRVDVLHIRHGAKEPLRKR